MAKRTFEQTKAIAFHGLKRAGCVALGCIAGKFLNNLIARRSVGTNGEEEDLLGLSPKVSKWVVPVATAGAGVAGTLIVKNPLVKDVALGVMSAGCVSLFQSALKKDLSTLLGNDDAADQPVALPGVGAAALPGVGDVNYEPLPSENDYVNNFNMQPKPSEGNGEVGEITGMVSGLQENGMIC